MNRKDRSPYLVGQLATISVDPMAIANTAAMLRDGRIADPQAFITLNDIGYIQGPILAFHPEICKVTIFIQIHKRNKS